MPVVLANTFHERLPHYIGQHQALVGTPWSEVYPAHVLRHVQITVYKYLQALQWGGGGAVAVSPEVPDFRELLRDLQRGSFHTSASWFLPLPAAVTVEPSQLGGPRQSALPRCQLGQRGPQQHPPRRDSPRQVAVPSAGRQHSSKAPTWQTRRATRSSTPCSYAHKCASTPD